MAKYKGFKVTTPTQKKSDEEIAEQIVKDFKEFECPLSLRASIALALAGARREAHEQGVKEGEYFKECKVVLLEEAYEKGKREAMEARIVCPEDLIQRDYEITDFSEDATYAYLDGYNACLETIRKNLKLEAPVDTHLQDEDPAVQHHSSKQGYERINHWINAPKEEKCPVCEPVEERE